MRNPARTSYTLRRLHSLTGVVPVGLFLLLHLAVNSAALRGPGAYDAVAARLDRLPLVRLFEVLFIAAPLLFHLALGVIVITAGQANVARYPYPGNWRYLAQRLSGLVVLAWVVVHVWTTRLSPEVLGGTRELFGLMAARLADPWLLAFSVLGVLAAAWHFSAGLFGFAIHWGLASRRGSQRAVARAGYALFVLLSVVGVGSLLAFRRPAADTQVVVREGRP